MSKAAESNDQWRTKLTAGQYKVLREGATELPGTGALLHNASAGTYVCAGCGSSLFASEHKFNSKSGWPSFYDVSGDKAVDTNVDTSLGMARTEVRCRKCQGHLGHVFNDAHDKPTGKRYCVNSAAMKFIDDQGKEKAG